MKTGYKPSQSKSPVAKGYAKNVNVVNTPTVKISHEPIKPMLPSLNLSDKDLPEVKNWKVGGKYTLTLEVEQTGMRQGNEYETIGPDDTNNNSKISATFKILSVKGAR